MLSDESVARRGDASRRGVTGGLRCCLCCDNGKCIRCSCIQARKSCINCLPFRRGHCLNCSSTESVYDIDRNSHRDASGLIQLDSVGCDVAHCASDGTELSDFVSSYFQDAFGACLLHSEGGPFEDVWYKLWLRIVSFKSSHYDLLSGPVGHEFIDCLTSEVSLLARGLACSERLIIFLSVLLQRDPLIRRGTDICRLQGNRLKDWKSEKFDSLIYEAERCARQFVRPR